MSLVVHFFAQSVKIAGTKGFLVKLYPNSVFNKLFQNIEQQRVIAILEEVFYRLPTPLAKVVIYNGY